jgi:hypothetical protein
MKIQTKFEFGVWHLVAVVAAFLFVSHGRSLLFEYMLVHGHEIKHYGIYSVIVWITCIAPLVFARYKLFIVAVAHYVVFHLLVVQAAHVTTGKALAAVFAIVFILEFYDSIRVKKNNPLYV